MINAIVFDLDNTLIDFVKMKKMSIEAAASAMVDAGFEMEKDAIISRLFSLYDVHGWEDQTVFQRFLSEVQAVIDYRVLSYAINAYRKVRVGFLEPYPHVTSTLYRLKQRNVALAILTDAPKLQAWTRLAAMKIDLYFDAVLAFEDTQEHKPGKKPFEAILKALDLPARDCLMVGDMPDRDMLGAKSAGMQTCYAKYGARYVLPFGTKNATLVADYEISDIRDLLTILEPSAPSKKQ